MPQLYSYLRWSSGRQEKGTTRTRQAAAARAYAAEHKLEMIEIIEPGLSAFRGKNRKGKLGDFIDAVKSGTIPSDSYLVKALITRFRDGLPGNMKSVGKHPW